MGRMRGGGWWGRGRGYAGDRIFLHRLRRTLRCRGDVFCGCRGNVRTGRVVLRLFLGRADSFGARFRTSSVIENESQLPLLEIESVCPLQLVDGDVKVFPQVLLLRLGLPVLVDRSDRLNTLSGYPRSLGNDTKVLNMIMSYGGR